MTRVKLINQAADPSTPAAGSVLLYSKTDKKAYIIDDAGLVTGPLSVGSTPTLPGSTTQESTIGAVAATSLGTTLTAHATAGTKGSWTQIVASSAIASDWILVILRNHITGSNYCVDIGVGAAASEVVKIPNLPSKGSTTGNNVFLLPYRIAAGSRIAARCTSNPGSGTVDITIHLLNGVGGGLTNCEASAFDQYSRGVNVICGTANVKGSWAELLAAISGTYRFIIISSSSGVSYPSLLDIGIGAAASETVLIADICTAISNYEGSFPIPIPITIASGTRIVARIQTSTASSASYVSVHGFY